MSGSLVRSCCLLVVRKCNAISYIVLICSNNGLVGFYFYSTVNNVGISYPYPEYFLHIPDLDNVSFIFFGVKHGLTISYFRETDTF